MGSSTVWPGQGNAVADQRRTRPIQISRCGDLRADRYLTRNYTSDRQSGGSADCPSGLAFIPGFHGQGLRRFKHRHRRFASSCPTISPTDSRISINILSGIFRAPSPCRGDGSTMYSPVGMAWLQYPGRNTIAASGSKRRHLWTFTWSIRHRMRATSSASNR